MAIREWLNQNLRIFTFTFQSTFIDSLTPSRNGKGSLNKLGLTDIVSIFTMTSPDDVHSTRSSNDNNYYYKV